MKFKFVVIDPELSSRAKRIAAAMVVPLLVLGGGAVAYASVPHSWIEGDTLTAADLNGNFGAIDQRVSAIEAKTPTYIESTSNTDETAATGTDFVY